MTCLPMMPRDIAVTHLPGGVTVSTRAIDHIGARPGEIITNFETMILARGYSVEAHDSRDRNVAALGHVSIVAGLLAGGDPRSMGFVDEDADLALDEED